jgi:hypothetical protein
VAEDDGRVPKSVDVAKLIGNNATTERLLNQINLGSHHAAIDVARILPDVSGIAGLADAARLVESYHLKKLAGLDLIDSYKVPEIAGIDNISKAHLSIMGSFRVGSLADMIGSQSALAALAPSLGLVEADALEGMLEGVRERHSVFGSAIEVYMDQQRAQAERITGLMETLAMPRIDPARFGIGSVFDLSKMNAFRIAGLAPDYADQYRSIFGAVNERISAFAERGAVNAFALQPDLVGGIGSLLARVFAQQEALLEQQRHLIEQTADAQQKTPSRLVQQLQTLAAIVAILQFLIIIVLQIEERTLGGDPAILDNTAAIEENTQAIEQMRGSFDLLADQLTRMHVVQEEADKNERAADVAIIEILREISDTLADQTDVEDETP